MNVSVTLKRFALPAIIVLAAFGIMSLLSSMKKEQRRAPPRPFVRTVATHTVTYDEVRPRIGAMGRVRAESRITLTPEVSGLVRDKGFRLRKGMSFTKGQVLMRIDARQALYALNTTLSDLRNALTGLLAELKIELPDAHERWQSFFRDIDDTDMPAIPQTQTEREKLLAYRYNVYKLYYAARGQQVTLSKHTIRAPFTGTVEQSSIYPSSMVRGGSPVATIARTDRVEIEIALSRHQSRFVTRGMAASVSVDGTDASADATVHRIGEVIDETMQTIPVFIRVENARAHHIPAGAYARVELSGKPLERAIAIPRSALHDSNRVYVVVNDTLAEKIVEIASLGLDTAYVTDGISEGMSLVVEPVQDAVVGMAAKPSTPSDIRSVQHKPRKGLVGS